MGGVGAEEAITGTVWATTQSRFWWLFVNLLTAVLASWVISWFDATIQQMVAIAVLMPIVASMGGNAGTQTMTVAVRALATRQLGPANALRVNFRECAVGLINGLLFAGLLALLALGLNLVFGVIDVVWICYAELVMVGMYGMYWSNKTLGAPLVVAALFAIALVAIAGVLLHLLVIRPVLDSAPINQLLVTGGVLFFLQAAATLVFGIDFRSTGVKLGALNVSDMSFSWARILSFTAALLAMLGLRLFLTRTHIGTAIRALSQDRQIMPLMGVDARKIYLITSAIGGGLAGLAAALMTLQYDIYPQIGLQFGPIVFMICVLGGLGNLVGGFVASFIVAEFIAIGGSCVATEWGYAVAFLFFMLAIFIRPAGLFGAKT